MRRSEFVGLKGLPKHCFNCKKCGTLRIVSFGLRHKQFCSNICAVKYRIGPLHPRWKGGIRNDGSSRVFPKKMVADVRRLYRSGKTQLEISEILGASEDIVRRLMKNNGIKTRGSHARKGTLAGAKNPNWKGDSIGYYAQHTRVANKFGRPRKCAVCGSKGKPARYYHWANLTGNYHDTSDYKRMCVKCHVRFDTERRRKTGKRTSTKPKPSRNYRSRNSPNVRTPAGNHRSKRSIEASKALEEFNAGEKA